MLVTDSDSINSFSGKPWTAGDVLRVFFLMFIGGMMLGQGSVSFTAIGLAGGTAKRIMRTIDRVPLIVRPFLPASSPPERGPSQTQVSVSTPRN
jgi:hypothetical protein